MQILTLSLTNCGQGVNFINILHAAFTLADPESAKKLLDLTVFFALLVSAPVKSTRRTLMKSTQGRAHLFRETLFFFFSKSIFLHLKVGSEEKPIKLLILDYNKKCNAYHIKTYFLHTRKIICKISNFI